MLYVEKNCLVVAYIYIVVYRQFTMVMKLKTWEEMYGENSDDKTKSLNEINEIIENELQTS